MRLLKLLPVLVLLSGCASWNEGTPGDPYEKINRKVWKLDQGLDKAVAKPVARGYISVVPAFLRHGLSNMLANVEEPFSAGNAVLQAKPRRALNSVARFLINSTVGLAGFTDQASKMGLKPTPEDLGQTFAVWGARKSSYLVLPLFGPSTIRDGLGTLAARWADPYRIVIRDHLNTLEGFGITAFEFVDARANLIETGGDSLLESSADSYAVVRSAYLQRRDAEIADQDGGGGEDAALDAALNDLGPADASDAAAAGSVATPSVSLAPDQANPKPAAPSPTPRPD